MAAAAGVEVLGGSAEQAGHAIGLTMQGTLGLVCEELERAAHGHAGLLVDGLAAHEDRARLRPQAGAVAGRAGERALARAFDIDAVLVRDFQDGEAERRVNLSARAVTLDESHLGHRDQALANR